MTSLTYAVVLLIGLAGAMIGKAQQTEPLFLDTTLIPVVELSIRNVARSSASSIHDVYTVSKATRILHNTAYTQNSPVTEAVVSASTKMPTTVTEYTHDLHLDSTPTPTSSNLDSQGTTVRMLSPVSSWDISIMPSFTAETVTSHSFTKFMPSVLLKDVTSGILEPSETSVVSTPNFDSLLSGNETLSATSAGGIPDMTSQMLLDKSESSMQLHKAIEGSETTLQILASEGASAETVTPPNWYVSETQSISNGHNMLYGIQSATISASSPEATSSKYDDVFKTSVLGLDDKHDHNLHDIVIHPKRLGFVLKKRCSDDGTLLEISGKLNEEIMGMLNNTILLNENQSAFICERVFHITVPIKNMTDPVIRETVKNLTKNFTFKESFRLENVYLYQNDHTKISLFSADAQDQTANNFDEYTLSERELIAYIVAGISVGTLVFILMTCCCVRLLCKKQTTSLDLCDIPHLNLKLEDYKLTPIPRPTISFSEYGRELFNPSYNEHTPKMEDTILNQHHFTTETSSPGARESMSFPREMRTFGGKKSCSRVQSLDARPNVRSGNGWISNSREKLSTDFERRNSGLDNVAFRKWF